MSDKCACKGSFLDRCVQPSILMLLMKEDLHGFSILKKLYSIEVMDYSSLDPTGLYRTLKKMEEAGLLRSKIDAGSEIQLRRIYSITDEGKICLIFWIDTLQDYRKRIDSLASAVRESVRDFIEYCESEENS